MNDLVASLAVVSLASAAVLAEANLLRVLIAEHRSGRNARRRKRLAARAPQQPGTDSLEGGRARVAMERHRPRTPLAAGVLACACLPGLAAAEPPPEPAPVGTPNGAASTPTPTTAPASPAPADDKPAAPVEPAPLIISTDRPSFSETTSIVPPMHLQIETGYTFTFRNRDDVETQRNNAPGVLARFGLLDDRLELRLSTSGYVWSRTDDGTGSGFSDSEGWSDWALGFKLKLCDQDGWLPRLAFDATTTLGAGSDNISSQMVEPILRFIWSYDLGLSFGDDWKGFTVGGNANVVWTTTSGQRFTQGQASVYLSFPTIDRGSGFVEYYVLAPNAKGADAAHYVDVGGVYLITDVLQLDARVGLGLNKEADNFFVGFGLSYLF